MIRKIAAEYGGLESKIKRFWEVSGKKIYSIENEYDFSQGSPVFTWDGRYTARGWTEWTEGFVYGSAVLQFDATDESEFLSIGRSKTIERMAKHITHTGVHDHGFNNVSTYGNLRRLMLEERIDCDEWELGYYDLALKCSGAVQAARWSSVADGGYIYSFNGPQSLFADTIRSLRSLAVAYRLGHVLMGEHDEQISLLERLLTHAFTTAKYIVYMGKGRDAFDLRGRVVHEAIFNMNDGRFRCPSTQQGYSPFSTWTRGLAWIVTGFAEELEFLQGVDEDDTALRALGGKESVLDRIRETALATAEFYLAHTASDYIPYWDTGAPGLDELGAWREKPADPYNDYEPVDSSAAAITAQGLLRLGRSLSLDGDSEKGARLVDAGIKIIDTLLDEPYLSTEDSHQGLLLHSVYHRPNGWDRIPEGRKVPCDESCMWGDYHLREAVLYLQRILDNKPYYTFWGEPK